MTCRHGQDCYRTVITTSTSTTTTTTVRHVQVPLRSKHRWLISSSLVSFHTKFYITISIVHQKNHCHTVRSVYLVVYLYSGFRTVGDRPASAGLPDECAEWELCGTSSRGCWLRRVRINRRHGLVRPGCMIAQRRAPLSDWGVTVGQDVCVKHCGSKVAHYSGLGTWSLDCLLVPCTSPFPVVGSGKKI